MYEKTTHASNKITGSWKVNAARLALGLSLIAALSACGGGGSESTADADETDVAETSIVIDVAMTDNAFSPANLTAKVGQEVEFVLTNNGAAVHNMIVDGTEFQSSLSVNPGAVDTFTAVFSEPGVYKLICVYHQPDMTGEITIE